MLIVPAYRGFSLGTACLYAGLRARVSDPERLRIFVRDYAACFSEVDNSFIRDILLLKPNVVGFSNLFWSLERNLHLAEAAKALAPEIVTVFGGPQVGEPNDARRLLADHEAVDCVVCGEGDTVFPDLVCLLLEGAPVMGVKGCVDRAGIRTAEQTDSALCDPESVPVVFCPENAYATQHIGDNGVIGFQTLRGCRRRCAYCLYANSGVRVFPLDRVERELAFLCTLRPRYVRMCDSHFGGTRKRALALFEILRDRNDATTFTIYPDPEHINREYVHAAEAANCRIVSLGVQTLNASVSNRVNRPLFLDTVGRAVDELRCHGVQPRLDFMYGLPGQTLSTFRDELVQLKCAGAEDVFFTPLMLFPGTVLGRESCEAGVVPVAPRLPQRFGRSLAMNSEDYASLAVMADAYRFLSTLHRADWFVRTRLGETKYAHWTGTWLDTAAMRQRSAFLEVQEGLRGTARGLRARGRMLAADVTALICAAGFLEHEEDRVLADLVHMDLLEYAMHRRHTELCRDILGQAPAVRAVFLDEALKRPWMLDPEVWLEKHRVAPCLANKGPQPDKCGGPGVTHTIYACRSRTVYQVGEDEFAFLLRFGQPRALFDPRHPYSTTQLQVAHKWMTVGVLHSAANDPGRWVSP